MLWEQILDLASRNGVEPRNILQEELQKVVLTSMSHSGCFDSIVFQGGTALRLFYNNPRFSEDINLVHRVGVERFELAVPLKAACRSIQSSFPFLVDVESRVQKDDADLQRMILKTISDDLDRRTCLHVELAFVPSYHNEPRILEHPPIHPAVRVETEQEILADKICALSLRTYVKGRDLWDIYFLSEQRSVDVKWDLVEKKVKDYKVSNVEFEQQLSEVHQIISSHGERILEDELNRFLPKSLMMNYRNDMDLILRPVLKIIEHRSAL